MVSNLQHLPGLWRSDHSCLKFDLNCYTPETVEPQSRPNMNRGDYVKANQLLEDTDWEGNMTETDFDTAFDFFSTTFENILDTCIPKTKPKHNSKSIFMTKEALRIRKKKYHHWKRYTETQDYLEYARFTSWRNTLRNLTRSRRRDFEKKLAKEKKTNPKAFWRYVNSRLKTKTKVDTLHMEDGSLTTNNRQKADTFNKFFSSVFTTHK